MATCKDCIHYDVCQEYLIECAEHGEAERLLNPCSKFKNKSDFAEVVRCIDCEHYEVGKSYIPYCNNVMNLFEEMKPYDFCCYGKRVK